MGIVSVKWRILALASWPRVCVTSGQVTAKCTGSADLQVGICRAKARRYNAMNHQDTKTPREPIPKETDKGKSLMLPWRCIRTSGRVCWNLLVPLCLGVEGIVISPARQNENKIYVFAAITG